MFLTKEIKCNLASLAVHSDGEKVNCVELTNPQSELRFDEIPAGAGNTRLVTAVLVHFEP